MIIEINTTKETFEEKESNANYLYVPLIGNLKVYSDLNELDNKHRNYFQIKINQKVAFSVYLEQYFKSDLGQLSLKTLLSGNYIKRINKTDLSELMIPLPPLNVQKEIITSYKLLDDVSTVINNLEDDLSLNPGNAVKITNKLSDTLSVLNELSKIDKVLYHIRQGESLTTEFKQTFSTDVRTGDKGKYIEESTFKNIAGFLNRKGGVLLIGVNDNGEIIGIENDFYKSNDKYLLHFKNKLDTAIGMEKSELVYYEIIEVNRKKILFIECKPSDNPVFLNTKEFYVRTNPATNMLEGPKMVEYIERHFKK